MTIWIALRGNLFKSRTPWWCWTKCFRLQGHHNTRWLRKQDHRIIPRFQWWVSVFSNVWILRMYVISILPHFVLYNFARFASWGKQWKMKTNLSSCIFGPEIQLPFPLLNFCLLLGLLHPRPNIFRRGQVQKGGQIGLLTKGHRVDLRFQN